MALQRAKHEGIDKDKRLKEPPYSGNLAMYAVARLSYYMCYKCKKPYFGGLKS
jgi:E3 ubiquitin-protein ligase MYCBP2